MGTSFALRRFLPCCFVALLAAARPGSETGYFPPSLATTNYTCPLSDGARSNPIAVLSDFEARWFSSHLRAAKEPSIYAQSLDPQTEVQEAVRFTWLRSFHPPVTVRVSRDRQDNWRIVARELSGAGGYAPGRIRRTLARELTAAEVAELTAQLSLAGMFADESVDCTIGLDGAQWIVERLDRHGYHFINRWSPSDGPVREVGLFLVGLTGWHYKEVY